MTALRSSSLVFGTALALSAALQGQTPAAGPATLGLDSQLKGQYAGVKRTLTQLADVMPAESYSFQPTPAVRTFASGIAHAASANFGMCGNLTGQPNPMKGVDMEKTITTKADATKALADSFAFCDTFVSGLSPATITDTYAGTARTADGKSSPILVVKAGLLANLVEHGNEMYGYLAMYLRLKGLTPPTSAPPTGRGRGGEPVLR